MKKQFKGRQDVFQSIRNNLLKIGLKEMQRRVSLKFFDMDEVVEILYRSFISGKNVILWGPGGFGKSEVVIEFLEQSKTPYSTIVGYEDMDVEGLLGLPNMNKLLEESTYEIAFEKTVFTQPGILILEEFLDVNPKTAIALKDIITSGGYRSGNNFVESMVSSLVICSNTSPYEMSTNRSTSAFYKERFPIVHNVTWNDYSYGRYIAFIKKLVSEEDYKEHREKWEVLAELAYRTCEQSSVVSPRIVKDAVHILQYNNYELSSLKMIDGIDTTLLEEVISISKMRSEESRIIETSSAINTYIIGIISETDPSSRYITDSINKLNYINNKLDAIVVESQKSLSIIGQLKDKCKQAIDLLWSKVGKADIDNPEELNELFSI